MNIRGENMDKIENILNIIETKNFKIEKLIREYHEDNLNDEKKLLVYELFDVLRDFVKINEVNLTIVLQEYINDTKTIKIINQIVDSSLIYYKKTIALRHLEIENLALAKLFINDIFNFYIIRLDPEFYNYFEKYNLKSKDDIKNISECIDFLINFYISKSFVESFVVSDLINEIGISDELALYCGELYENNYQELKQNYFFSKINEIEDKLN